ncbi:MAG: hypothetical protein LLF76_07055 [Planctomycetaceae bacterium]|nr:hypothetical protein [Planctomycetaceae bacterium]
MKLPQTSEPLKYIGLYVVDFGDHSAVGFTAEEVAELLESEEYAGAIKVYRIYRANPDGTMELKGVSAETFQNESGMFFWADDEETARGDYDRLLLWAARELPPARCKVRLSHAGDRFITALIYPAEHEDVFSSWLIAGQYRTSGQVQAGPDSVTRYYQAPGRILDQSQLWPAQSIEYLRGSELLDAAKRAFVR